MLVNTCCSTIKKQEDSKVALGEQIQTQGKELKELKDYTSSFEFQTDELKFLVAKLSRRNEVLEKDMRSLSRI